MNKEELPWNIGICLLMGGVISFFTAAKWLAASLGVLAVIYIIKYASSIMNDKSYYILLDVFIIVSLGLFYYYIYNNEQDSMILMVSVSLIAALIFRKILRSGIKDILSGQSTVEKLKKPEKPQKQCSKCHGLVNGNFTANDICPHCGCRWGIDTTNEKTPW